MKKSKISWIKAELKHFTLIEVLVVCGLLAFLMGLVFAGANMAMKKASDTQTRSIIEQVNLALEAYKEKTGTYPYFAPVHSVAYINNKSLDQLAQSDFHIKIKEPVVGQVDLADFFPNYQEWKTNGIIDSNNRLTDAYGEVIYYRFPGYFNRTGFDLESSGSDCEFGEQIVRKNIHGSYVLTVVVSDKDAHADNISNWVHNE